MQHMDAWAKMNSPAFNMIAHGMLRTPEQRRNFVVGLVTEYRPEHDPPFEVSTGMHAVPARPPCTTGFISG